MRYHCATLARANNVAVFRTLVKHKLIFRRMLSAIVHQGVREGVFTTAYPDQAGEVILSLLHGMGNTHAKLLLSLEQEGDELRRIDAIITTHAAYMDAIERMLGAPANSLYRTD